ncbi:MAG: RICIN domain-containing protein [Candidatus Aminicenantes bacterium]|nr:RICIN domain-containing protein [Candidatus Aminicenantes bacterium]
MKLILLFKKHHFSIVFLCFLLILMWLFPSGAVCQESALEKLLKKGLGEFLGKGKIDSIQIVEGTDSSLVLDVAYSDIKVPIGVRATAEALRSNNSPLPGFRCEPKIITGKQGSVRLTLIFHGNGSNTRVKSYGVRAKLFLASAHTAGIKKVKKYSKTWISDPSALGSISKTSPQSVDIIDPVPMFNLKELAPSKLERKLPAVQAKRKRAHPVGKAIPKREHPVGKAISVSIDPNSYYQIVSKSSGKCLEVKDWSKNNGANVQQWQWHGGDNQWWKFVHLNGGYYRIECKNSGKCLDIKGRSNKSGANVQQFQWNGGNNQQWKAIYVGNGYYKIVSKNSGKCLDVKWGGSENGVNVWQWDDVGSNAQRWKLIPIK